LFFDQPTRGVDIGATDAIRIEILRQREAARAILLISAQLDELVALADRILVTFASEIMGELSGDGVDHEDLGLLIAGVRRAALANAAELAGAAIRPHSD